MRPRRLETFDYIGPHRYFLTWGTFQRQAVFVDVHVVEPVLSSILHTAGQTEMVLLAYCFMSDHVHLLVEAAADRADLQRFVKLAKQVSGYRHARTHGRRLWQEGYHERVLRDSGRLAPVIAYILNNPVRAGLVASPLEYPFLGSAVYSREELAAFVQMEVCRT